MESDHNLSQFIVSIRKRMALRPHWYSHAAKRLVDIVASAGGLVILFPVFCLLAFLIKHDSSGPVFYRGPRLGKGGKRFGILKFRTMRREAASQKGPSVTAQDDPRITPFGRWLRDTKLNELPQLWNVLVGEMSLVGPRPEDPEIAKTWPETARREVLSVRPGITSPASVIYRDEEKMLTSANLMDDYLKIVLPDKLRLDQLYVRNHHFLSDLDIIVWTLVVLLPRLRENSIPMESFYNGLLYRFTNRYFSWLLVDSLVAFAAVGVAGVLWRLSGPLDLGIELAIGVAAAIAFVFSLVNSKLGLGRVWWRYAKPMYVFDLALSSGISTLLVATSHWFWPNGRFLPLGMVFVAGLLAFLGFVSVRYRERLVTSLARRWIMSREHGVRIGERILVVGAGECGMLATWLLRRSKLSSAFSVIGMVDDDPTKEGMMIDKYRVLGLTRRIPEIVKQRDVGVILFAIEKIEADEQARILNLCRQTAARVVLIPDLLALLRAYLSQSFQEAVT
jgi:lipopolysaccharide/colanic/teichoic acid biosynthesis glycosyltransferase